MSVVLVNGRPATATYSQSQCSQISSDYRSTHHLMDWNGRCSASVIVQIPNGFYASIVDFQISLRLESDVCLGLDFNSQLPEMAPADADPTLANKAVSSIHDNPNHNLVSDREVPCDALSDSLPLSENATASITITPSTSYPAQDAEDLCFSEIISNDSDSDSGYDSGPGPGPGSGSGNDSMTLITAASTGMSHCIDELKDAISPSHESEEQERKRSAYTQLSVYVPTDQYPTTHVSSKSDSPSLSSVVSPDNDDASHTVSAPANVSTSQAQASKSPDLLTSPNSSRHTPQSLETPPNDVGAECKVNNKDKVALTANTNANALDESPIIDAITPSQTITHPDQPTILFPALRLSYPKLLSTTPKSKSIISIPSITPETLIALTEPFLMAWASDGVCV